MIPRVMLILLCDLVITLETFASPPASAPATRPAEESGSVPASACRPIAPAAEAKLAALLKRFDEKPEPFAWRMQKRLTSGRFEVYAVQFPSPLVTETPSNNTVHCEYFRATGQGKVPAVLVLDIMDGSLTVARLVAGSLAASGTHALIVQMPYYGPRRPANFRELEQKARQDPQRLVEVVSQAVMDIRRGGAWLATRDEVDAGRIGICGVSLGGFAAALTAGVDGHFPRAAVILAGGNLPVVLTGTAREVRGFKASIEANGWSADKLREMLEPVDPLTYASRLKATGVIMINARDDEIVPAACSTALAEASGAKITWYPATHYTMMLHLLEAIAQVSEHFSGQKWK